MEGEAEALYLQLHKLSAITSEEGIDRILTTLWKTRKTGLQSTQKSSIQALLNLPSPTQLDPVLACLRSLIRKCARENFSADDLLKLFPPDLSLDLQSILILLLQKYQNQWKEEISRETNSLTRSTDSNHAKANLLPTFASFPSFVSTPMWLHQDDTVTNFNHNQLGVSTPVIVDSSVAPLGPMQFQRDAGPPTNLGSIPCLKSMTWTMEKSNSVPGNRVAVISLKLQDYNKSPSGEIEVKFQLTRDILEAMLRSLTYIGEQLSNLAGTSSGPAQKKQKQ
ncbi:uncharacterized protein LOC123195394 isoform X2 [Mangifera indica]|uniref:uncharacterized protein LOC123195394 isoform X2 n=1 Tax=Mangifera indica TaxID=29780 RepID=UPI001CF9939A|nr:uncharacterized protein LOC123195394 isoform X2 [Mangifera indica]